MKLDLHAKSRDNQFEALAVYNDGRVIVKKNSKIKYPITGAYKPSDEIQKKRNDATLVDKNGKLLKDVEFCSLSTAASFVAGRSANGMLMWKTENGKKVGDTLKKS